MQIDFKAYMQRVDAALVKACGMPSECLPDYCYYDSFQDDVPPNECAQDALEYARTF